jgi:hypothetical protein
MVEAMLQQHLKELPQSLLGLAVGSCIGAGEIGIGQALEMLLHGGEALLQQLLGGLEIAPVALEALSEGFPRKRALPKRIVELVERVPCHVEDELDDRALGPREALIVRRLPGGFVGLDALERGTERVPSAAMLRCLKLPLQMRNYHAFPAHTLEKRAHLTLPLSACGEGTGEVGLVALRSLPSSPLPRKEVLYMFRSSSIIQGAPFQIHGERVKIW